MDSNPWNSFFAWNDKTVYIYLSLKSTYWSLMQWVTLWCFLTFFLISTLNVLLLLNFQAVMSSDIAIAQFRFLERLLLVHGHWCYRRISSMVLILSFQLHYHNQVLPNLLPYRFDCWHTSLSLSGRSVISSTRTLLLASPSSSMRCMHHSPDNQPTMIGSYHFIMYCLHHFRWLP